MFFKIINPDTLAIESSYESDSQVVLEGSWATYPHLPVGALDPDCVKAELIEDVIALVEDPVLVAAKAQATKVAQCDALESQLWQEILTEMEVVYGTKDMNSATAYFLTWKRASESPASFVGTLFPDEASVTAWVNPKLASADAFAVWRLEKIAACNAAKEAIMGG